MPLTTPQRIPPAYKDSFGFLRTALLGVTTWTDRQLRTTGIVLPHIAKGDVFSYNVQLNHDKQLDTPIADFHLHIVPIGAPAAGQKITIDYLWGIYKFGDAIPATLPYGTSVEYIFTGASDQYKHLYFEIFTNAAVPLSETYSNFLLVKCTRRNDGTDTYADEFALLGADCHYATNRNGSLYETHD